LMRLGVRSIMNFGTTMLSLENYKNLKLRKRQI